MSDMLPGAEHNPAYLKLELASKGVRFEETEASADGVRDVELVLPHQIPVIAPLQSGAAAASPFMLSGTGERLMLHRGGSHVPVRRVPAPRFYGERLGSGRSMREVGTVFGSFIAIYADGACGFALRGAPCRFCRSASGVAMTDGFPSVAEVVEVVRAAFAEGAVESVYFNPPYAAGEDAGIAFLEPYIRAVKRHFDTLVAVQMHPPKTNRWIDRTYAMGVDALSYAVELHDPNALARRCPGRARLIGRERYDNALGYAATVFPSGTVWTDLMLGMESVEATQAGIAALVGMHVLPVLAVSRVSDPLAPDSLPGLPALQPVFDQLFRSVLDARINMGWVRELSYAITPLEARFFVAEGGRVPLALQHFYGSRVGYLAARGLSRLRRRLRVRTISDSFDSAHL